MKEYLTTCHLLNKTHSKYVYAHYDDVVFVSQPLV